MGWLFHIKYYKNMTIWHDIGRFFSYQSHTFSTRIFQELLGPPVAQGQKLAVET